MPHAPARSPSRLDAVGLEPDPPVREALTVSRLHLPARGGAGRVDGTVRRAFGGALMNAASVGLRRKSHHPKMPGHEAVQDVFPPLALPAHEVFGAHADSAVGRIVAADAAPATVGNFSIDVVGHGACGSDYHARSRSASACSVHVARSKPARNAWLSFFERRASTASRTRSPREGSSAWILSAWSAAIAAGSAPRRTTSIK